MSFGELRSLLHQSPSAERDLALGQVLSSWTPQARELGGVFDYLNQHLSSHDYPIIDEHVLTRYRQGQLFGLAQRHTLDLRFWRRLSCEDITRLVSRPAPMSLLLSDVSLSTNTLLFLLQNLDTSQLRYLDMSGCDLDDELIGTFVQYAELPHIHTLCLSRNSALTDHALSLLRGASWFSQLTRFDVSETGIGDDIFEMQVCWRHLDIRGTYVTDEGFGRWLSSPFVKDMRQLYVSETLMSAYSLPGIQWGPCAHALESLSFGSRDWTTMEDLDAVLDFLSHDYVPALRELSIHLEFYQESQIRELARALIAWPGFPRLRALHLEGVRGDCEVLFKTLLEAKHHPTLETLGVFIDDSAWAPTLESFFAWKAFSRVQSFHIHIGRESNEPWFYVLFSPWESEGYWDSYGDEGFRLRAIIDASFMESLERITICSRDALDAEILALRLLGSKRATALREVLFDSTTISTSAAQEFLDATRLSQLTRIGLPYTPARRLVYDIWRQSVRLSPSLRACVDESSRMTGNR